MIDVRCNAIHVIAFVSWSHVITSNDQMMYYWLFFFNKYVREMVKQKSEDRVIHAYESQAEKQGLVRARKILRRKQERNCTLDADKRSIDNDCF